MGRDSVYVIGDLIQSNESQLMKLVIQKVTGIDESISLVSAKGFAVGATSNSLFRWEAIYQDEVEPETAETTDIEQLVPDKVLVLSQAEMVEFSTSNAK